MNSVYECHMFYKIPGEGGYHGHLATLHDNLEVIVTLHSECCEPIHFLDMMSHCQDRNLACEMFHDSDGISYWVFHSMGEEWQVLTYTIGECLVDAGEAVHG